VTTAPTGPFDAIVIGTGFGGGAAARRLAAQGLRVLILERGRLYPPGSFPRNPDALARNVWDPSAGHYGMFDLWSFRTLDALVASGVGGGSLIYANVLLRKEASWFVQNGADGEHWPVTRADLDPHYDIMEKELAAQQYPFDQAPYDRTGKTTMFRDAAQKLQLDWMLPKLAVVFGNDNQPAAPGIPIVEGTPNLHGRPRVTCMLCGECDIGCNYGAKSTTDLTLVSRAVADGAKLQSLAEACEIRPLPDGSYEVGFLDYSQSEGDRVAASEPPMVHVRAPIVVVAAGALGSTYLLLRNRKRLPKLSPALGTRFSGNGDLLAFIEGRSEAGRPGSFVDAAGGPVITSAIAVPDRLNGGAGRGFYVQEGGLPVFASWLVEATGVLAFLQRLWLFVRRYVRGLLRLTADSNLSAELGTAVGAQASRKWVVPILGMGRDVAGGRMDLDGKWLDVDWPARPSRRYFEALRGTMRDIAKACGGRLRDNPMWLLRRTITVHPLGGCPMGRDASTGVVDSEGQVFGYPGLIVADGSVMPGPVGANPSLTIAALADRFASAAARRFHATRTELGGTLP
jgi:cholesterol oxidase